jgi:hypothetical protein
MALLLAGITMLVLPSHGNTSGWKDSYNPALPAPGGSYAVGVRRTRLLEAGRPDPWRPDTEREVMVDIHYPADSGPRPLEQYYVSAAMTELGSLAWAPDEEWRLGLVSDEVNWLFRTHSHEWAPPAAGRFPILMLSTPPGLLRTSFTGLAAELARHGYVVVSVDHPYDAPVVEFFPTRRVVRATDAQVPIPGQRRTQRGSPISFLWSPGSATWTATSPPSSTSSESDWWAGSDHTQPTCPASRTCRTSLRSPPLQQALLPAPVAPHCWW